MVGAEAVEQGSEIVEVREIADSDLAGIMFITTRPGALAERVLRAVDRIIAVGDAPEEVGEFSLDGPGPAEVECDGRGGWSRLESGFDRRP